MLLKSDSLRRSLLLRVGTLLALLLALDALSCYLTAIHFANVVHDRWLVDSVRSLSQALRQQDGRTSLDLSRSAEQVFSFDAVDRTFFKVSSTQAGFIAGQPALPDATPIADDATRLQDARFEGRRIRLVSLRLVFGPRGDRVQISVAETLNKRAQLTREILLAMVAPQVALLAIAGLFTWFGVSRGLKPLTDLSNEIETRDHENLAPVSESGLPKEARVLVLRINELLQRLANAIQAQRRFVADAAHQLRTPLASLLLQTERIERAPDEPTTRQATADLRKAVERAAHLSQQLLTLARTDPASVAANAGFQELNLAALAREVGEEWAPRALAARIDFGLQVPGEPVTVSADRHLLGAMLANLIDNALRYGGAPGRVTLAVEPGTPPTLSVTDDGRGIPAEALERVFERFYRVPGTDSEGCGLGLAIVHDIVRLHQGSIRITAGAHGRGTRVEVTLPAR